MVKINKKISKYNYSSRSGKSIQYIVIHYVGAVSTAANNVTYFAGGNRSASAHYFTDDTSIWQSVEDKNAAWHCGGGSQGSGGKTFYGKCTNSNSLGIEMCCKRNSSGSLYITDATIKNTADLTKYLMKKYNVPASRVIRHYDVTGKDCPAPYINATKWKALHKTLTGSSTTGSNTGSSSGSNSGSTTTTTNILTVDGSWGVATSKLGQKWLKTTIDGIISRQPTSNKKYLPNAYTGSWKFTTSYKSGSLFIKALQKEIGTTVDGYFGRASVKAFQTYLKKAGYYTGSIDGYMGPATVKAFQKFLNKKMK